MKNFWKYFAVFLILISTSFWSLLNNLGTHLVDWRDYPLYVWTIFQNIDKFVTLNFANFFETTSFYPNKLTLLFSDTLLPQSLIALPFSFLSKNPILVFNLTFFVVLLLNYFSSFLFWKQIFKKSSLAFLGAIFVSFSPFIHLQLSHFQMINFWPFFFALYFLFKNEETKSIKNILLVGMFLSIQFLASVYLAIFLAFAIFAYYVAKVFFEAPIKPALKNLLLIALVFILLDGVFIKGYIDIKNMYNIKREYSEFVTYSAHVSDYLFTTDINSILHNSSPVNFWNSFNKHGVGEKVVFPGFLLATLSLLGLFSAAWTKKQLKLKLSFDKNGLFFLILLADGFLNSLGPRLNFNGAYGHIPTPYTLYLKVIPFFETIRAPARWSFLFYLGIAYFTLLFLKKYMNKKRSKIILPLILTLFVFEYIPININTHAENYLTKEYEVIKEECKNSEKVLLEIPVTHLMAGESITEGLSYITKVQLASLYHDCNLVNGYSGYDPQNLQKLDREINEAIIQGKTQTLITLLNKHGVRILKINPDLIDESVKSVFETFSHKLANESKFTKLEGHVYQIVD